MAIAAASLGAAQTAEAAYPVIFFHGATGNKTNGFEIEKNLTAEGRAYVALDFCQNNCSVQTSIYSQIQGAIKQIRGIVSSDARFENGYHFLAHSQGASVARGVIEEMDDHKVHSFISMAGDGNGIFYGPQASDQVPLQVLLQALGPFAIDTKDFDFSKYGSATWNGKVQRDFTELSSTRKDLQATNAIINTYRPPIAGANAAWLSTNTFLPKVNNLEQCGTNTTCSNDQKRRKANFLKLKAAHFFASPQDDIQSPWQTCILGKYTDVASINEVETKFSSFKIVDMKDTDEYKQDLYGLQTLDKAGRLHLHAVPNVGHDCWLFDYVPVAQTATCLHDPVYSKNIYPVLV
uniref:AB hydrolase-1 domain-containing protein n=1 Tax=Globisporangium ultimum (strain ATCC 200006 / CBS 805.95 / DAOM BR144) TaxID=431595 RepID=K3X3L5_GLOUD